ncbi:MAG: hypothetical protein HW387_1655 [Parachlamydiales bacterium]|nr:hypothetical protein [Parachlamydiales bacterium]
MAAPNSIELTASTPQSFGDRLLQPALWYGRQVSGLFSPLRQKGRMLEVAKRVVIAFALLIAIPFAIGFVVIAIPGLGKNRLSFSPSASSPVSRDLTPTTLPPPQEVLPQSNEGSSIPEVSRNASFDAQKIKQTVKGLNTSLEAVFGNLRLINEKHGIDLSNAIQDFERENDGAIFRTNELVKERVAFEYVRDTFRQLRLLQPELYLTFVPRINDKHVMQMPGDGNCLFHTLSAGLRLVQEVKGKSWEVGDLDQRGLRIRAVAWMRAHRSQDEALQHCINQAIEAYQFFRKNQLQDSLNTYQFLLTESGRDKAEIKKKILETNRQLQAIEDQPISVEDYFNLVEQPGFFASSAELYAISCMFQVQIQIERQVGGRRLSGLDPSFGTGFGEPAILVVHVEGTHFELGVRLAR